MKDFLIWAIISSLLFLGFIASLIIGLVKKRRTLIIISLVSLLFLFGSVSHTVYIFASKSYKHVSTLLKPRSGEEIYSALFGKAENNCLKILNYQDQIFPKIDYAIWLHFTTCPDELKRILQIHQFKTEKQSTKGWKISGPLANENWYKPETIGDSVLVFTYKKDEYGNGQTILFIARQHRSFLH